MTKKLLFIPWLAITLLIFIQCSCSAENTGHFTIVNNAKEIINYAKIEICKQSFEVKNLKPRENYRGFFQINSDSHYTISITFISGKKLKKQIGYVTNGFDVSNKIIITDYDIFIDETSIR